MTDLDARVSLLLFLLAALSTGAAVLWHRGLLQRTRRRPTLYRNTATLILGPAVMLASVGVMLSPHPLALVLLLPLLPATLVALALAFTGIPHRLKPSWWKDGRHDPSRGAYRRRREVEREARADSLD